MSALIAYGSALALLACVAVHGWVRWRGRNNRRASREREWRW